MSSGPACKTEPTRRRFGPARSSAGWYRGIRIGSAIDGFVTAFIPDPNTGAARGTGVAEGVTADDEGNVYGAEVADRRLRKYVLNPLGRRLGDAGE